MDLTGDVTHGVTLCSGASPGLRPDATLRASAGPALASLSRLTHKPQPRGTCELVGNDGKQFSGMIRRSGFSAPPALLLGSFPPPARGPSRRCSLFVAPLMVVWHPGSGSSCAGARPALAVASRSTWTGCRSVGSASGTAHRPRGLRGW